MKIDWNNHDRESALPKILFVIGILVAVLLFYIWRGLIGDFFSNFIRAAKPLLYAVIIAYILWPMLRFFEQHIFVGLGKNKPNKKLIRTLALILTYAIFLILMSLFIGALVPQIVDSMRTLAERMRDFVKTVQNWFGGITTDNPILEPILESEYFEEWNSKLSEYITKVIEWLYDNIQTLLTGATSYVGTFATEAKNVLLGIVFGIYFLLFKEDLLAQIKKFFTAILTPRAYERAEHYAKLTDRTFGGFINGKLLDSLIIGILCYILMKVFKMPYASLISMIIGITNIIPFFGPFIGAIPSTFFILIADPKMTIWFVLMILLLQQLDGNLIGPKILGNFVGLSPLWTIIAITIMGGLFGVFGMFFGVPIFAVIYAVVKELTENKLTSKELPIETVEYYEDPAYNEIINPPKREHKSPKWVEKLKDKFKKE